MRILHLVKHFGRPALAWLAFGAVACPLAGLAATANVSVQDFQFVPSSTTINVNDRVTWTWAGAAPHNTTSNTGLWTSPSQTSGSFSHSFTSSGNFPYKCTIHPLSMNASVTVQGAANVPPVVHITSPTNGATFAAPWTGTIHATASDPDGTVSKVQYFAGATLLGTVSNPASTNTSFTVTNLAAGNYTLTAAATDNNGASTTSVGVAIKVVAPGMITLSSPKRLSATTFQFDYDAVVGLNYEVLRGGDLAALTSISTNTATTNLVTFTDSNATGAVNFYGVHLVPNP
jgi:plastocyanin